MAALTEQFITDICNEFKIATSINDLSRLLYTITEALDKITDMTYESYVVIYYKVLITAILDTATNDIELAYFNSKEHMDNKDKEILLLRTVEKISTSELDIYNRILNAKTFGQLSMLQSQVIAYVKVTDYMGLMENLIFYYMLLENMLDAVKKTEVFKKQTIGINRKRVAVDSKQLLIDSVSLIH